MNDSYDLESLNLPRLSGRALRLFAGALDNPALRPLLLGRLLREGGLLRLREGHFEEPPTFYPPGLEGAAAAESPATIDQTELARRLLERPNREPFPSAADYARAYRSGAMSPLTVAERVLDAIEASDRGATPLRAFRASIRENVIGQAQAATERIRAGAPLGILDGVPVAVKDEIDQVPYGTTLGTAFLGREPAGRDATLVARLRAAGALLIGKTVMNEIGINPDGFNAHYGTVRNPYNPACHAGGSSSGSAAAVAAGICPAAIGADGGGSIRIPAALCGVVGLKATFGRITESGVPPLTWSMGHVGPIGATAADVALIYACIAGPDPADPMSLHQSAPSLQDWDTPGLDGLTAGVFRPWFEHAAPAVVADCSAMLERLKAAGLQIREIEIPGLDDMRLAQVVTILAEMWANMRAHYAEHGPEFGAPTRINLALGRATTGYDYLQAQRVRTRALNTFRRVFSEVDVVLTPATAVTAPVIPDGGLSDGWSDLNTVTELMRFVFVGNLTGLPAIAFPTGYDEQGLPTAMQAMGRPWSEHVLLRIAGVAGQVTERRRPALFYGILGA